jgi:hypothetical protein
VRPRLALVSLYSRPGVKFTPPNHIGRRQGTSGIDDNVTTLPLRQIPRDGAQKINNIHEPHHS